MAAPFHSQNDEPDAGTHRPGPERIAREVVVRRVTRLEDAPARGPVVAMRSPPSTTSIHCVAHARPVAGGDSPRPTPAPVAPRGWGSGPAGSARPMMPRPASVVVACRGPCPCPWPLPCSGRGSSWSWSWSWWWSSWSGSAARRCVTAAIARRIRSSAAALTRPSARRPARTCSRCDDRRRRGVAVTDGRGGTHDLHAAVQRARRARGDPGSVLPQAAPAGRPGRSRRPRRPRRPMRPRLIGRSPGRGRRARGRAVAASIRVGCSSTACAVGVGGAGRIGPGEHGATVTGARARRARPPRRRRSRRRPPTAGRPGGPVGVGRAAPTGRAVGESGARSAAQPVRTGSVGGSAPRPDAGSSTERREHRRPPTRTGRPGPSPSPARPRRRSPGRVGDAPRAGTPGTSVATAWVRASGESARNAARPGGGLEQEDPDAVEVAGRRGRPPASRSGGR